MMKSTLQITYIGHATVLIKLGENYFLTDPNFSQKIWPRYQRLQAPGLLPAQIPQPQALLIGNAHYDHLDLLSLKYFKTPTPIIVPKGLGVYVRKFFPGPITELKKGASHQQGSVTLHAVSIEKRGDRLWPFRLTQTLGYVLESSFGNVYFVGDTGFGNHFKQVSQKFAIDVALLPIQPRPRRERGAFSSLSPEQALQAFQDLNAKVMIPILWDAFQFGKESPEIYLAELMRLAKQKGLESKIRILRPGQSYKIPPLEMVSQA